MTKINNTGGEGRKWDLQRSSTPQRKKQNTNKRTRRGLLKTGKPTLGESLRRGKERKRSGPGCQRNLEGSTPGGEGSTLAEKGKLGQVEGRVIIAAHRGKGGGFHIPEEEGLVKDGDTE